MPIYDRLRHTLGMQDVYMGQTIPLPLCKKTKLMHQGTSYLSEVIDGTGLGTDDVLPVLLELLDPWFCCSDCICSAAEYNVDNFLEHT